MRFACEHRRPGIGFIELEGEVPWGALELERALLLLSSDARTSELEVWASRPIASERWAAAPIWWVHDASAILASPRPVAHVIEAINALPYIPPPSELVVVRPSPTSVSAASLDELALRLDAGLSWIYADKDSEAALIAESEVSRASAAWGVRYL